MRMALFVDGPHAGELMPCGGFVGEPHIRLVLPPEFQSRENHLEFQLMLGGKEPGYAEDVRRRITDYYLISRGDFMVLYSVETTDEGIMKNLQRWVMRDTNAGKMRVITASVYGNKGGKP